MSEKCYSVAELDALRRIVRERLIWGTSAPDSCEIRWSRPYRESEMNAAVEESVRTHMLAGHLAADILAADIAAATAASAQQFTAVDPICANQPLDERNG